VGTQEPIFGRGEILKNTKGEKEGGKKNVNKIRLKGGSGTRGAQKGISVGRRREPSLNASGGGLVGGKEGTKERVRIRHNKKQAGEGMCRSKIRVGDPMTDPFGDKMIRSSQEVEVENQGGGMVKQY